MTADPTIGQPPLDVQIKRYHRSYRRRLRRMAGTSRQLADLIHTFPAAALVFATGQGRASVRAEASALVADGAELRRVARALALPGWLRRLPPEAFAEPIAPGADVPASEQFTLRIANHVPADPAATGMWLAWVLQAYRLCDEDFALWVAAQPLFGGHSIEVEPLLPLAAYAWFSGQTGLAACGLIRRPWTRQHGLVRAVDEARNFTLRVMLEHCRDQRGASGRWHIIQRVAGLRFVPLSTAEALEDEGERMANCVGGYVRMVAHGECLIYGIRRGNAHVATLEIRMPAGQPGKPVVAQLEGPGNSEACEAVQRAAAKWISRQGRFPVLARAARAHVPVDEQRWTALWSPYWAARAQTAQMARQPVGAQLMRLNKSVETLVRLAKV